ncbi:hypothetical protein JXA05_03795 [Candidatus Peregrinibacteria bacterium]|nr:hypothetical protein [Candidatus Peregrinibacteria bacterium]
MHHIQQKILALAKIEDIGKMTLREIGIKIGQGPQPQKIKHHLEQLKKRGFLKEDKNKRSIRVTSPGDSVSDGFYSIPLLGAANCGEAVHYAEAIPEGYLKVSKSFLSKQSAEGIFALRAIGDSMNRASPPIEDGDYVLIDSLKRSPQDGDYILSIIDGCANIKKYIKDSANNQIVLISESSSDMMPIFIDEKDKDDYMVNGVVIKVVKKPRN